MKYEDYQKAVIEQYPIMMYYTPAFNGANKIGVIKKTAELLFIDGLSNTALANETRKQMISLRDNGVHCFDR